MVRMWFLALGLMAAAALSGAGPAKPEITTLMYLVNRPDSIASFREHAGKISIIAPQTFSMDAQGFILGEVPPEVLQIAGANHVAVMPLVTNRGFKQPLMHTVLDTPESRARAIRYLMYYVLRDGFLGFQFDYENIHYTYRDKFSAFFREASHAFHEHGLKISAAIVGRMDDTRKSNSPGGYDNWSGVYDYGELGRYADFLSIMAYAEHGSTDNPGPVAGLPWVTAIARYSASLVPPQKVSLGIPFYGMRWEATPAGSSRPWRGRSARYSDAAAAIANTPAVWDDTESSPHVALENNGRRTEMWFEDARSLQAKMELAHDMGFQGVSAWVLGQEDPAFWDALNGWRIRRVRSRTAQGTYDERSRRAAGVLSK